MTGQEFISWRAKALMTQLEMATALGVDPSTVRRWEREGLSDALRAYRVKSKLAELAVARGIKQ